MSYMGENENDRQAAEALSQLKGAPTTEPNKRFLPGISSYPPRKEQVCPIFGEMHQHTVVVEWSNIHANTVDVNPAVLRRQATKLLCPCGDIRGVEV